MQVQPQVALSNILFARYYSNQTARFLSRDPASSKLLRTQSWNGFSYVENNPLRYHDPSGEDLEDVLSFAGGVIRGATASASNGAYPGSTPQSSDSTASLLGQLAGSAAVTVTGAIVAIGGATEATVTAPAALTVFGAVIPAAGAAATVAGTVAAVGGAINMVKISNTSSSGSDSEPDRDGAQDKRLTSGEIKALENSDIDVHELKGGKGTGKLDLFKDQGGDIYVKPKSGAGPGEATGLNIRDFKKP